MPNPHILTTALRSASRPPRDAADVDAREPTPDARDRRVGFGGVSLSLARRSSSEWWARDDVADTAGPIPIPTDDDDENDDDDGTGGEGRERG